MEATSPRVLAIYQAEEFGFGSGTFCLPYVSKGEEQFGMWVGV